jgi:membrane-associated phospholipid phosphatase
MTTLGLKYIPRRWQPVGWAVAVLFVLVGGFSRIYSGAHWPTDVLAGLLIGVGWLSFVLSIRWVSDSVLEPRARPVPEQKDPAGGVDRKTASM